MFSIVTNTRNDDHGGHQMHRLQTFVNGIAQYRELYKWNVELVIVEWNPMDGWATLEEALTFPADLPVRILRVPLDIHNQFDNAATVPMFFHLAHNVGIRRARGQFVLMTSQDILFSDRLARFLAHGNLNDKAYYRAVRFDTFVRKVPKLPIQQQIAYCARHVDDVKSFGDDQLLHTRACGDFILMHRDAWERLRGFPEWGVFGIYLDGLVVHAAYTSGLQQLVFDLNRCIYHIDHKNQGVSIVERFPRVSYKDTYLNFCHQMLASGEPINVNDNNWGLADCEEEQVGAHTWQLVDKTGGRRGMPLPAWTSAVRGR
jgi:hypothetical protein